MSRIRTLRFRFALWVTGLLLVVLVGFGALVYSLQAQALSDAVDTSLRLSTAQASAGVNVEDGKLNFSDSIPPSSAISDLRDHGLTIRIFDVNGQLLQSYGPYQNLPINAKHLNQAQFGQPVFSTEIDPSSRTPIRLDTAPILDQGVQVGVVQVGLSLDQVRTSLANLLRVFLLSIPGLILVAGVGGYSLAGRALSPIDQITQTARRISARDLSARLNLPPGKDELGRLAATIDEMLGRLEGAFHREQRFVADASHELRTPLTAMQAILSVVRAKRRTIEDYEHALADIAEETDRLRALTENLLVLARTDMQPLAEIEPVDLSLLLTDLYSSMRPLAVTKGLAMTNAVPPGLILMGDRDGLTRLFINLIDNAIKYAQKGDVQIAAGRQDDTILWVTVFDTGCGIPEDHLSHIFERFYRVDPSRTSGGAGLGLAIAQEIAQNHEGNIRAESTVGVGTKFTVTLASRPDEIRGR